MRWLLGLVLICIAGISAASNLDLLGRIERAILYPFDSTRTHPSDVGLTEVTEATWQRDGVELILWHVPPKSGKPTIVYFHGNAGNLAARAGRFKLFREQGFGLIALSPRGAGGSGGVPTESSLSSDASDLLRSLTDWQPKIDAKNIVLYGESLGTGIAISAIQQSGIVPAGLILEAPYTSIVAVAAANEQIPDSLLARISDTWDSLSRTKVLTMPLLVVHGTQDALIPFSQGKELHDAAPSTRKKMLAVSGAGHADLWRSNVIAEIMAFARNLIR
ncbi:MAG: alpha/beta hydrolase [Aliishimia sp.]